MIQKLLSIFNKAKKPKNETLFLKGELRMCITDSIRIPI